MDSLRITDTSCLCCFAMLDMLGPALNSFLPAVRTASENKVVTLKPRVRRGWPALSTVSTGLKIGVKSELEHLSSTSTSSFQIR